MITFSNYCFESHIQQIEEHLFLERDVDWYGSRKALHTIYEIPYTNWLRCYVFHAVVIGESELGNPALHSNVPILTITKKQAQYLQSKCVKVPVCHTGSLFVRYRRIKGIVRSTQAKGSLFFLSHSSDYVKPVVDDNTLLERLKEIPNCFKPVNICVYFKDISSTLVARLSDQGYSIYCAGHANDPDFIDNFYEILKHHRAAFTNAAGGSHIFYCNEFGIPIIKWADDSTNGYTFTDKFMEVNITEKQWVDDMSEYCKASDGFFSSVSSESVKCSTRLESEKILGLDHTESDLKVRSLLLAYSQTGN